MSVRLFSVLGNSQRLDGGAMFGNVPKAMWSQWLPADAENRVSLACRALYADGLAGKRVLFETGIGAFFEPKLRARYGVLEDRHVLLDNLDAIGVSHEDVDVVVLSHLHFDHAGGLLAPWQENTPPCLLFPNACFVVGAEHWQRAVNPHPRDRASFIPELMPLLEQSGRLELVDGAHCQALGESVRFHYSQGHTPGLMLSELVAAQGGMLFCADLIPGMAWIHVPVSMGYDRFPEQLIEEKRALLDELLQRGVRLFFTHDPEFACASIVRDAKSRYQGANAHAQLHGFELTTR
jgi:glyoxylase-like metal-dependent hydrolase (beta-lactamase superfamily II)